MRTSRGFAAGILFGWGILLMVSPVALYLFIHAEARRYAWILAGPEPFSNFGSAPYQLRMYVGLFAVGIVFLAGGLILGSARRRADIRRHSAWLA
ncbi:hypothetical protein BLJ79_11925 [Arthrobacter sp. UCD-GKA]|uniref:hypothetical protein n=1 Tax=Arthrobacter sp. UCD-GKA TaxID=1913576 RepID=UPI0008DC994B|nr:hypothetical protein [Arthrobacter sp. UCD-GKA]OIH84174.1 hypothetical protein BLJ79_11925 [Arthrobacter sp. UCD-GKA]